MQSSAQEVKMLFKLIAAAKDSWACLIKFEVFPSPVDISVDTKCPSVYRVAESTVNWKTKGHWVLRIS